MALLIPSALLPPAPTQPFPASAREEEFKFDTVYHDDGIAYAQCYRHLDVARARRGALASKTESVFAGQKWYQVRLDEHEADIYGQRATAGARYVL